MSGEAAAFISSSISALDLFNGWEDPTTSFLISKLKDGCRRFHPQLDGCLPFTPNILEQIINSLPLLSFSQFEGLLFRSSFLMIFLWIFMGWASSHVKAKCDFRQDLGTKCHFYPFQRENIEVENLLFQNTSEGHIVYFNLARLRSPDFEPSESIG